MNFCYFTAPEGLSPPQLLPISDHSLQVVWSAPAKPNGQVTGYYIYLDGVKISTNQTTAGSYIITDLQPYTVYTVQVTYITHQCMICQPVELIEDCALFCLF